MRLTRVILEGLLVTFLAGLFVIASRRDLLVALSGGVAICVIGLTLIGYRERSGRWVPKRRSAGALVKGNSVPGSQQPPPFAKSLQEALLQDYWGDERYKPSCSWNDEEGRAYLNLHRRDGDLAQGLRVRVFDPTGISFETNSMGVGDEYVTVLFPDAFQNVVPPLIKGDYAVKWFVLVENLTEAEIDGGVFRVPHDPRHHGTVRTEGRSGTRAAGKRSQPGWHVGCAVAPPELPQGRGVRLTLEGPENAPAVGVVCRVVQNDGVIFESGKSEFGVGDDGWQFSKHYPSEFKAPPPTQQFSPYTVVWLANVGDVFEPKDVVLDELEFTVDEIGRPQCK